MELQVGVKIVLKNDQGEWLVIKRSTVKYPNAAGRWDAVGGRINPGVALRDNLAREVKEETGLELAGEVKLIAAQDILRVPGKHIVRLTYTGRAKPGEIKLDKTENEDYRWLSLAELMKLEDVDSYVKELLDKGAIG